MRLFNQLRSQFPVFHYHDFSFEFTTKGELRLSFHFEIEGLTTFSPQTFFELPKDFSQIDLVLLRKIAFYIGCVEAISYWKSTCSPLFKLHCGYWEKEEFAFWEGLFYKGLGEFRYLNQVHCEPQNFVRFEFLSSAKPWGNVSQKYCPVPNRLLIPLGGGKDSAVTLELLKDHSEDVYVYLLNPLPSSLETARIAGISAERMIQAHRKIDSNLLKLNQEGYLNGHTPFSALLSFHSLLLASIFQMQYAIVSNESSANEGNVLWDGVEVNHQYSKSLHYEESFLKYNEKYLLPSFQYFSFLRPVGEYDIARVFAGLKQYHSVFRSCNQGQKTNSWCGQCPKCVFTWVMLSPWLPLEELLFIFKQNLWQKKGTRVLLKKLAGFEGFKPFECVGTTEEVQYALHLILKNSELEVFELIQEIKTWPLIGKPLQSSSQSHYIPVHFYEVLQNAFFK